MEKHKATPPRIEPPAPQPCESCAGSGCFTVTYEMAADAGQPDRYGAQEECRTCGGSGLAAATPQVTPTEGNFCTGDQDCRHTCELEIEQEVDGRWIAELLGVAAYGKSREEAIRNAAKVLIESAQAREFKPYMEDHEYYDHPDLLATIERIANHGSVDDYTVAGIRAELRDALHNFKREQASPTPEK